VVHVGGADVVVIPSVPSNGNSGVTALGRFGLATWRQYILHVRQPIRRYASPRQLIVITVAVVTFLPAITIEGAPRRWVDPTWVEGLATFWALLGATYLIRIELRRDRRQERQSAEVAAQALAEATQRRIRETAAVFCALHWQDQDTVIVVTQNHSIFPVLNVRLSGENDPDLDLSPTYVSDIMDPGSSTTSDWDWARGEPAVDFQSIVDGRNFRRSTQGIMEL